MVAPRVRTNRGQKCGFRNLFLPGLIWQVHDTGVVVVSFYSVAQAAAFEFGVNRLLYAVELIVAGSFPVDLLVGSEIRQRHFTARFDQQDDNAFLLLLEPGLHEFLETGIRIPRIAWDRCFSIVAHAVGSL